MKARLYITTLVTLVCVALFVWKNVDRWRYGTFDAAKWSQMSAKEKQKHRYFMAQDIVTSASLMGKSSAEVRSLLGNPDKDIAEVDPIVWTGKTV